MTLPVSLTMPDGTRYGRGPVPPPMWRVLHDRELPSGVRQVVKDRGVPLPEVFPLAPSQFTSLNLAWQRLWRDLNPQMSNEEWRKLLHYQRAFTNGQGFEKPGDPRVDYINARDLGAEPPKIESLVCGGALLTGEPDIMYRGELCLRVKTLDGRNPPPLAEWVLNCPWLWFEAVSVRPDGGVQSFSLTPYAERVPVVASIFPVYMPMSGLKKVN